MLDAGVYCTDDFIGVTLLYTFVFVKTYFVFGDFVKNIVSFDLQSSACCESFIRH